MTEAVGGRSDSTTVRVTVIDRNDNRPYFLSAMYQTSILRGDYTFPNPEALLAVSTFLPEILAGDYTSYQEALLAVSTFLPEILAGDYTPYQVALLAVSTLLLEITPYTKRHCML